jgi:hypothetical protein
MARVGDAVQRLGRLGFVVACLPPHARAHLKSTVEMSVAASVAKRDRGLMFTLIEAAFADIEDVGREGDGDVLELLDGGRA